MVLKIVKYGEKVLRTKAVQVDKVTDALCELASDMLETMYECKGVGLAAQQVGRTEKLCVIDIPQGCETEEDELFNAPVKMPLVMFNPQIIASSGLQHDKEGCLSFPGIGGSVLRANEVTCEYLDADSKPQIIVARGFLARALQHEIDHLNAVLYIDRMDEADRVKYAAKLKKLAKANGPAL